MRILGGQKSIPIPIGKNPPRIENFNWSARAGSPFIPDQKKFLRPYSNRDGPSPQAVCTSDTLWYVWPKYKGQ